MTPLARAVAFLLLLNFLDCALSEEYVPGTPGATWSYDEVEVVRQRVLEMIDQDMDKKKAMFTDFVKHGYEPGSKFGRNRPISEMALFRLAFHDCFAYKNGSGGRCDGCLNFSGMGVEAPSPFASVSTYCQHQHPRQDKTDNNGLDRLVHYLEKIYTTTDWPTTAPSLNVSLKGSGKSRADLWQFAAHVALEKTIERSNFACRHDNFQRQQVPLLEGVDKELGLAFGIWKCKIKLSKPFRFRFGRSDCIPDSSLDAPYITEKEEIHDNPHENTDAILKSVKTNLKMSAKDLIALTAVHGMIHPFGMGSIGTKYNWIGSGPYLSNMYYKFLANRPTYYWNSGFDMKSSQAHNLHPHAVGDSSGKPVATWGMRVSCSDCWNTTQSTMGGPCVWRPTKANAEDCLNFGQMTKPCFDGWDENNKRKVADNNCCRDATFTPEGIQVGGKCQAFVDRTKTSGWSNSFALNYEVGLTHKFDLDPVAFRPTGCQGIELDDPTSSWANGSISNSAWLSPRADCPKQDLKDPQSGKTTSEIVEQFADDHDVWAKQFLGAWERMQRIGYTKWQLKAGPENSWMGYYPLRDMGATFNNPWQFARYVKNNKPLVFTKESIDPWICGNHADRCGTRVSEVYEIAGVPMEANGPSCSTIEECNSQTFGG